jgi:putative lipoprotein
VIPGLALVFTLHLGTAPKRAGDDRWLGADKARHFFTSALLDCLAYSAIRTTRVSQQGALVSAGVLTAGVGIGKELYDRKSGGDPSFKDLAADGAGIATATALLRRTLR